MLGRFVPAALAAVLVFGRAQAQTADQTLDRALAAYAKVRTVRATFEQRITNPVLRRSATSRGEMVQQRPRYVSVRFTDPAGDRIVADGTWLWLYLPSTNPGQVIKTPVGQDAAGTPDVTAQLLDSPKTRYAITDGGADTAAARPARVLRLVPKDPAIPFRRATIWVDDADGLIRRFETVDESGVVRLVTITRLEVNRRVDRSLFTFTPPKGVRVFEQKDAPS